MSFDIDDWTAPGSAGRLIGFGVKGTGSYGVGLARYLRNQGHEVHEIARPTRAAERRLAGKNDTIDAEHAARQLLARHGLSTPKTADGAVETIRLVKIAYDGAVQARTTAMITLKATLATGSESLRAELEKLTDHKLITACAALEGPAPLPPVRRGAPARRGRRRRLSLDPPMRPGAWRAVVIAVVSD